VTEIAVLDPTLTRALPAMVEEIASGVRVSILPKGLADSPIRLPVSPWNR